MASLVSVLEQEEKRLVAELQRLPLYRQLEGVRHALKNLTPLYDAAETPPPANAHSPEKPEASPLSRGRSGSLSSVVTKVALAYFERTGRRASSSAILDMLKSEGTQIASKKPTAQIASILSHNSLFDNNGDQHGMGYGLRAWTLEAPPPDPGASAYPPPTTYHEDADPELKEAAHGQT